jgi:hypothetical protein
MQRIATWTTSLSRTAEPPRIVVINDQDNSANSASDDIERMTVDRLNSCVSVGCESSLLDAGIHVIISCPTEARRAAVSLEVIKKDVMVFDLCVSAPGASACCGCEERNAWLEWGNLVEDLGGGFRVVVMNPHGSRHGHSMQVLDGAADVGKGKIESLSALTNKEWVFLCPRERQPFCNLPYVHNADDETQMTLTNLHAISAASCAHHPDISHTASNGCVYAGVFISRGKSHAGSSNSAEVSGTSHDRIHQVPVSKDADVHGHTCGSYKHADPRKFAGAGLCTCVHQSLSCAQFHGEGCWYGDDCHDMEWPEHRYQTARAFVQQGDQSQSGSACHECCTSLDKVRRARDWAAVRLQTQTELMQSECFAIMPVVHRLARF